MTVARYTDWGLYRRLILLARPYWPQLLVLMVVSLGGSVVALILPLPLKVAVDSVIGSQPLPSFLAPMVPDWLTGSNLRLLGLVVVLVMGIALLNQLQNLSYSLLSIYSGEKLLLGFRAKLFSHAQRLSLAYHDRKGPTDSLYRIQHDAPAIRSIAVDGVIPFVTAMVTLVSMFYIILLLDWQLALVTLVVAPFLFFLTQRYRRRIRATWRELKKIDSAAMSVVQEVLAALRVVKAFGQEDREQQRFVDRYSLGVRARLQLALLDGSLSLLVAMTTAGGVAAVMLVGVRHVQAEVLTLGNFLLIVGYLTRVYRPMTTLSRKIVSLQSHLTSAERAFSILDEAPDVPEKATARLLQRAQGRVVFEEVDFSYGEDRPALRGLTFTAEAGTRVGIAGQTGSGKTTVISLLVRFYDPTAGRILLDGVDLRDYRVADLRNQFAFVLQEPVLFSTSIAENIAYGDLHATEAQITAAARAANAHQFISALPKGYTTEVGERGMNLSGGERQRIALARAFLKNAPILILDEPTSSVDVHTETAILEALGRLMEGRTTFLIAHRLATLQNCDRILVLDHGRLVAVEEDVIGAVQRGVAAGALNTLSRR